MRKWPLKKKNHISTSFKRIVKIAKKYLKNLVELSKKQIS